MVTQSSKQKKLSIFTAMKGKLAMLTLGTSMQLVTINSAKYVKKSETSANLIPSVMEVAAGIRDKLLVFGNDFETIDGTGVRDYIHVSDLARAHLLALDLISSNNSATINLGSERQYSVLEVIKLTEKFLERQFRMKLLKEEKVTQTRSMHPRITLKTF